MNSTRVILIVAALFGPLNFASAQILAWDFFNQSSPATMLATTVATGLDATAGYNLLTRGAGASASTGSHSFRTQGFQNDGISTANSDYFQFSLSAADGNFLSLSSITARFNGTATFAAAPGGVTMQFAYSLDGTNFTLIGSPFSVTSAPSNSPIVDLTAISALQNINSTTSVTLRFYASGQTATGGWGFYSNTSAGTNGLVLNGTIAAIPEPSTYAALFGALALAGVIAHRRRRSC